MKPEIFLPRAVGILSDLNLYQNYDRVIQSFFDNVSNVGTMVVTYNRGKSIIRARPMGESEARFTKVCDFSFKPQNLNCASIKLDGNTLGFEMSEDEQHLQEPR